MMEGLTNAERQKLIAAFANILLEIEKPGLHSSLEVVVLMWPDMEAARRVEFDEAATYPPHWGAELIEEVRKVELFFASQRADTQRALERLTEDRSRSAAGGQ